MFWKAPGWVVFISILLSACSTEKDPALLRKGDELYAYYCKECHNRVGIGPFYEQLPAGRQRLQSYQIVLMIKYGYDVEGHRMPEFTHLSDEQADALAEYVVAIQKPTQR